MVVYDRDAVAPHVLGLASIGYGRLPTAGGYTQRVLENSASFCPQRYQRGMAWRGGIFSRRRVQPESTSCLVVS